MERRTRMGIDGSEHPRRRKRGIGSGGHVCRAGFLCETAVGDFRIGDAIKIGTRQSRAPLRTVAGTRAPAERPVSLTLQVVGQSLGRCQSEGRACLVALNKKSGIISYPAVKAD